MNLEEKRAYIINQNRLHIFKTEKNIYLYDAFSQNIFPVSSSIASFMEMSEEEIMCVNGGCGGGGANGAGASHTIGGMNIKVNGTCSPANPGSTSTAISNVATYAAVCIAGPLGVVGAAGISAVAGGAAKVISYGATIASAYAAASGK